MHLGSLKFEKFVKERVGQPEVDASGDETSVPVAPSNNSSKYLVLLMILLIVVSLLPSGGLVILQVVLTILEIVKSVR